MARRRALGTGSDSKLSGTAAATAAASAEEEEEDVNLGISDENGDLNENSSGSDDEDDDDDSLMRLSEQYRRFSESQRRQHHSSNNHYREDDGAASDESDHDALMRSVHSSISNNNNNNNNVDDDDLSSTDDSDTGPQTQTTQHYHHHHHHHQNHRHAYQPASSDLLEGALRSFASRLSRAHTTGNSPSSSNNLSASRSALARMLPEALGLLDGLTGDSMSEISALVDGLSRRDDPYLLLETLNQLSEKFLMMNGERGLHAYDICYSLVEIINEPAYQEELELQLVACRCLYNFLEINNDYAHTAISTGAIEALQSKLLEISYIDLAEQALQTLEIISKINGLSVFRKNCLVSVLQYLDFFTIHAQRKAINITANSVKSIRSSDFELVQDIFPILQRVVIEFTDQQELDNAWLAISRIVKNLNKNENLSTLITKELTNKIIEVISGSDTALHTNLILINTLTISCYNEKISKQIIQDGAIDKTILKSLNRYNKKSTTPLDSEESVSIETLMSVPKDLIISVLDLISSLLPVDDENILTLQEDVHLSKDYSKISDQYIKFVNSIFPLLLNIYSSTVVYDTRRRVLITLIRIVSSLEDISVLKSRLSAINLLASIIIQNKDVLRSNTKDIKSYFSLLGAFSLIHILMSKDSTTFIDVFEREGIISDIDSLLEILRANEQKGTSHDDDEDNANDKSSDRSGHGTVFDDNNIDDDDDDAEEEDQDDDNDDDDDDDDDDGDGDDDDDNEDEEEDDEEDEYSAPVGTQAFQDLSISQILKSLTKYATEIEQQYLLKKASSSSKLQHLRALDEVGAILTDYNLLKSFNYEDWSQTWETLHRSLSGNNFTISSFELISSGIIGILSNLFANEEIEKSRVCKEAFVNVFADEPFELLIKKLQEALTRSESFEIIGSGLKIGENRAASLGKQLRIKLVCDPEDEEFFQGMNQFIIVVHAIASFTNINSFLKRRIENPFFLLGQPLERNNSNQSWHIEFSIDGEVIPYDSTIFGSIYKHKQSKSSNFDTSRLWNEVNEVKFRKVEGSEPELEFDDRYPDNGDEELESLKQPIAINILTLLKQLHEINPNSENFLNFKLTARLNRQLEEPLIVASGVLPNWSIYITRNFPYLFPLENRIFFLQSTSFGYSRLIQLWNTKTNQDESNANNNEDGNGMNLGRATRHKVRVSRNHLLQSAFKVLERLGSHPSVLEIEFTDEAGTGLGPTLEFYATVSRLFAKRKLKIWRENDDPQDEYVNYETGLFPSPFNPDDDNESKIYLFKHLGKFVARALLDNRILDLSFNYNFFDLCSNLIKNEHLQFDNYEVALEKLKFIDFALYKSLIFMQQNQNEVESLNINFTLPGYPEIELIQNGKNIDVKPDNLDAYIQRIIDFTLLKGVEEQIRGFIEGFSDVFPYSAMLIFTSKELVELLGKSEEDWSYETLLSCIHADHGYTIDSPMVQNLIAIMTNFSTEQRRLFTQFLTGSPRLPIGGFANLKPSFTIVLKHSEDGLKPDDYLPSVMTCANYLKLPNYSSPEVLEERLLKAVEEGAGAFLLS